MAVRDAPTDRMNYDDDALRTLRQLATSEHGASDIVFYFDVSLQRYSTLAPDSTDATMTGELSLAIYNDLKLSQYIVEDDNHTTRDLRRFSLTARGRQVAASALA